jgi:hypothetical protein
MHYLLMQSWHHFCFVTSLYMDTAQHSIGCDMLRAADACRRLVERLVGAGDPRTASIVAAIAEEERAHVAVGEHLQQQQQQLLGGLSFVQVCFSAESCCLVHCQRRD